LRRSPRGAGVSTGADGRHRRVSCTGTPVTGHVTALAPVARALRDRGHAASRVAQEIEARPGADLALEIEVLAAADPADLLGGRRFAEGPVEGPVESRFRHGQSSSCRRAASVTAVMSSSGDESHRSSSVGPSRTTRP
jgi:hypothetical protein